MLLLPALMAWRGRYHKNITSDYRVPGGKILLAILIVVAIIIIVQGIAHDIHL
jgi:amino acid permease